MHSLNSLDYPDIYINPFRAQENSEPNTGLVSQLNEPSCTRAYTLEVDIKFDKELCARYVNSFRITQTVLQFFMEESADMIQNITCVHISDLKIFGICEGYLNSGGFKWPSFSYMNCSSIMSKTYGCGTISGDIMETVKQDFPSVKTQSKVQIVSISWSEYRNLGLIFSEFQGTGSLAGITHRSQACSSYHGYSWISGINRLACTMR